jgi:hypothetical protein
LFIVILIYETQRHVFPQSGLEDNRTTLLNHGLVCFMRNQICTIAQTVSGNPCSRSPTLNLILSKINSVHFITSDICKTIFSIIFLPVPHSFWNYVFCSRIWTNILNVFLIFPPCSVKNKGKYGNIKIKLLKFIWRSKHKFMVPEYTTTFDVVGGLSVLHGCT